MKSFNKIFVIAVTIIIAVFLATDIYFLHDIDTLDGRQYRVEISRIALEIKRNGFTNLDLSRYKYVKNIEKYSGSNVFYNTNSDYYICEIDGVLYRFDYTANKNNLDFILKINIVLGLMAAIVIIVLIYVRQKIILPFDKFSNLPYELSKGNLTLPVKESKNRFFGKFLWGIDVLRESMEQQKQRELELQKAKNTMLLSISHDIKTPLSAIKLYSKAFLTDLYNDKDKQHEIAKKINSKADEIESFVSQLSKASSEEFLSIDVNMGEFYLSELINAVSIYYTEKLNLVKTDFSIEKYSDYMIAGDIDRSVEVLQNLIENAIKYGDGRSISISISEEDGCVLVTVKNSGCTLNKTELPHIFDSFWRGSNTGNCQGCGLGLYICRQIMHKINGEIFAEIVNGYMKVTIVFEKV